MVGAEGLEPTTLSV